MDNLLEQIKELKKCVKSDNSDYLAGCLAALSAVEGMIEARRMNMSDNKVRLIDAELLTTNIAQIAKACAKSDKQKALVGRILFMIENMPTIEAEPDNGWISVKDRLPENDGLYIVCKTVRGHRISFEARWKENKWLSVVKNNQLDYVTHWQHLPEPPKEDDAE